jgi:hypothetical protein
MLESSPSVFQRAFDLLAEVDTLLGKDAADYFAAAEDVAKVIASDNGFDFIIELFGLPFYTRSLPPGTLLIKSSRKGGPYMGILHHPMCPCIPPGGGA